VTSIRRAAAADCAPIWAVHTRAIRHGCAPHYAPEDIAAWSGRMSPATYGELLLTRSMFVAEAEGGRIAGFAQLETGEGVVEGVYVDPDFMRQGVGRALVAALEDEAQRLGLARLTLDASLNAVPFYLALGYRIEGDLRHALGGGHAVACKLMSKRLVNERPGT
jgi:GNAT superfamily N-acetyltransferase